MIASSLPAMHAARARLGHSVAHNALNLRTPGSHADCAGQTAATGYDLNNRRPVAASSLFGRSGRPGPDAAWPRAKSYPRPGTSPDRGAGAGQ